MASKITPPPQRAERIVGPDGRATRKFITYLENLDPVEITELIEIQLQNAMGVIQQLQAYDAAVQQTINEMEQQIAAMEWFGKTNGQLKRPPAIGNITPNEVYASRMSAGPTTFRTDIAGFGQKPDVQLEDNTLVYASIIRNQDNDTSGFFVMGKSRGTEDGGVTIVQDADFIGRWYWVAADGVDMDTIVARVDVQVADASPAVGAIGGAMNIEIADTAGSLTEVVQYTAIQTRFSIADDETTAFLVRQAANNYLRIETTNAGEVMEFGNAGTNPDYDFLGTGGLNAGGAVSDGSTDLIASSATLSNSAGVAAGTLANAPTAGDPTKWVTINDNGTDRYIPTWT